jgi:hypothetical protein
MKIFRSDFIFSYWILVWLILYFLHIVTIAPKLLLIIGLLENIVFLCFLLPKASIYNIIRFIFINFWIKVVPLYFLWDKKITNQEIFYSIIVCIIYILWLLINYKKIFVGYNDIYNSYIHNNQNISVLSYVYDSVYNYIKTWGINHTK